MSVVVPTLDELNDASIAASTGVGSLDSLDNAIAISPITTPSTTLGSDSASVALANTRRLQLTYGIGAVGAIIGIVIAVKRKSGFWGGVGWWAGISTAGCAVGYGIGTAIKS